MELYSQDSENAKKAKDITVTPMLEDTGVDNARFKKAQCSHDCKCKSGLILLHGDLTDRIILYL